MIWFTSDEHYNHKAILDFMRHQFKSVEEMNETIIELHNRVVAPGDTVWHLGDFAWYGAEGILCQLQGCEHNLILGNHDHKHLRKELKLFNKVVDVASIKLNHKKIWASHYPHARWPGSHKGTCHVFGHCHGGFRGIGRSIDVGVDNWNFYPISFDQVLRLLEPTPFFNLRAANLQGDKL